MVLKIFFPQCCNRADSGLLVGRWLSGHNSAVVLAVIHYPFIPGQVKQYIQQLQAQSGVELTVLGSWSLPKEGQEDPESFLRDLSTIFPREPWLQISRTVGKMGFSCEVLGRDHSGRATQQEDDEEEDEEDKVIFVHYEQRKVMVSQLHPIEDQNHDNRTQPSSELRQMFQTVARSEPLFFLDKYDDGPLKSTHWQSEGREASIIVELLKRASVPLCFLVSWLLSVWTWICEIRIFRVFPLSFLSSKLSTCVQVSHRTEHLKMLSSPRAAKGHMDFMRKANVLVSVLVDMVLGVLLMSWLYKDQNISMLAQTLVPAADHVARELEELLQWLMGAPAGLKMNRALDQVLGRFFLYHIHLWIRDPVVRWSVCLSRAHLRPVAALRHGGTLHFPHLLFLRLRSQAVLSEGLRSLVSLETLQGEEVERPAAESGLLFLRSGPAFHRNAAIHCPAVPASHHRPLLPGLHSAAAGGGPVPGCPSSQCGFHQLLPSILNGSACLSALQTGRRCKV
ncbi:phosphatidylinositol N-acetylglucosaminyltransferase subunit Q isoform X1 [Nematolebias whitei]|uniref:phosphatidylinositol N-acetylglucosaminyltransferase subunit Q isoform X1 n=1 Tax=Nematolebias whitei TaxID=451745 RepID=UPI001898DAC2|nr:phosphatidylinositol N-acetylglucosaminyltransferase subunit Q isoform X1 [Nematolebias whitei]